MVFYFSLNSISSRSLEAGNGTSWETIPFNFLNTRVDKQILIKYKANIPASVSCHFLKVYFLFSYFQYPFAFDTGVNILPQIQQLFPDALCPDQETLPYIWITDQEGV